MKFYSSCSMTEKTKKLWQEHFVNVSRLLETFIINSP